MTGKQLPDIILMTAAEVAALFRVDVRTVNEKYAYKKSFPVYIKFSKQKLWKKQEILEYIDQLQKAA